MSRETPEEREFAENCGWAPHVVERQSTGPLIVYWHPPSCGKNPKHGSQRCDFERHRKSLPDFLNDLAACFEALEWFCTQFALMWSVENDRTWRRRLGYRVTVFAGEGLWVDADGTNIQMAIIRAVNAAAKARPR